METMPLVVNYPVAMLGLAVVCIIAFLLVFWWTGRK